VTCTLELKQAYKGAGYNDCIYGTQANPVTNYANGQVYTNPSQGCVNFGTIGYIVNNATIATGEAVTLDPSPLNAGLTFTQVTANTLTAATQAYVINGFTGCNVAPGSTSSTTYDPCLTFVVDVSSSGDTDSGHVENNFGFIDGQSAPYVISHFATGAVTTFTSAQGAHAGNSNTGIASSTLTPTTNNNVGVYGPYVEQLLSSIESQ